MRDTSGWQALCRGRNCCPRVKFCRYTKSLLIEDDQGHRVVIKKKDIENLLEMIQVLDVT